jgi:hypothetical protein
MSYLHLFHSCIRSSCIIIYEINYIKNELRVVEGAPSLVDANERHLHILPYKTQYWGIFSSLRDKAVPSHLTLGLANMY